MLQIRGRPKQNRYVRPLPGLVSESLRWLFFDGVTEHGGCWSGWCISRLARREGTVR